MDATPIPDDSARNQPPAPPARQDEGAHAVRVTIGGADREWWAALHQCRADGTMPAILEPIANGAEGEITISSLEWHALRRWCQSLPGWQETDGAEQLGAEDVTP